MLHFPFVRLILTVVVKRVPSNVSFEVDDAEAKWSYRKDYFDFIHARMLMGAFFDWPKFLEQCFRYESGSGLR
jgi:hypothetical protein